ncbi:MULTISPECIES: GntR family transcriptional regulator [unclassified Luteococcus]|uniref:GntR family transcriptional regulator n=1 Tax=unclassified Luteococcus TaxID=2639923 RepID=UPI00313CA3CE
MDAQQSQHDGGPRAERCARALQAEILAGQLHPGSRLDEAELGERLGVSRNTLREAFRLLAHERLVEHVPNRGVFVQTVDPATARDVYDVRRQLEVGALDAVLAAQALGQPLPTQPLRALRQAVARAQEAASRGDWTGVGTANGDFHLALVALSGNAVAGHVMRSLVGLTRLRFLALGNPREVHEGFIQENERIAALLEAGQVARARVALEVYLLRAQQELA